MEQFVAVLRRVSPVGPATAAGAVIAVVALIAGIGFMATSLLGGHSPAPSTQTAVAIPTGDDVLPVPATEDGTDATPSASAVAGSSPSGLASSSGGAQALRTFYVDCADGDDASSGSTTGAAWRSLRKVNSTTFAPGDAVLLKRGCTFDGGLTVKGSGSAAAPITVSTYGTGQRPWVSNSGGGEYGVAVDVTGDHVVVEGLGARDATFGGVRLAPGTTYGTVRGMEITRTGFGVILDGTGGKALDNSVHDLRMIRNTPKAVSSTDDYGAVGFVVNGTDNEVAYNRCTNCLAPSNDYGQDGGFVEVWNSGDRLHVHHNVARNAAGFFELGAEDSSRHANDVRVAYNVLDNVGTALNVNRNDLYGISVTNLRFENNTVIRTVPGYATLIFPGSRSADLVVRNNIFYTTGANLTLYWGGGTFTHDHNLYTLGRNGQLGFALGSGEFRADPAFVSLAKGDYRLTPSSPARQAGRPLGYRSDLAGRAVPSAAPDLGAYQS